MSREEGYRDDLISINDLHIRQDNSLFNKEFNLLYNTLEATGPLAQGLLKV